ncbi:uncharacterized protein [Periplaneta americana]|uniref:uncharacterized protein n=1 Tax=Periplaneta americana TaxID=6978 RepID=UPI0037E7BEBC
MDDETPSNTGTPMLLVTLNPPSHESPRSVSPMIPSPTRELRGLSLFRAISRRLGRHRHAEDDEEDDDVSQSSSDSDDRSSGSAGGRVSRSKKCPVGKKGSSRSGFLFRSASCTGSDSGLLHLHGSHCTGSSGGSSSGSDTSSGHVPRHDAPSPSPSLHQASSFRKVFQSLTRNSRSHSASCATSNSTNNDAKRRVSDTSGNGAKKKNKSILRAPVAYTYVRGLSGLPTQRVPRGYPCVYLPTAVCCGSPRFSTQHLAGLNR